MEMNSKEKYGSVAYQVHILMKKLYLFKEAPRIRSFIISFT